MNWVWGGCGLHLLGAVCELIEWPAAVPGRQFRFGFHEVFHVCSAVASVALFLFVAWYVIPSRQATATREPTTGLLGAEAREVVAISGHAELPAG
jgi:hypothetical protein